MVLFIQELAATHFLPESFLLSMMSKITQNYDQVKVDADCQSLTIRYDFLSYTPSRCTRKTSFPRGSITLMAMRL